MKGISPLLASILLIAITVAVASLASGWFTSTIRAATTATTNRTNTALDCSGASVSVDSIYITGTTSAAIKAVVRNNGQIDGMTIVGAQAYNTTGGNFSATGLPVVSVNQGSIVTLSFVPGTFVVCPTSFASLVVTTNCGGISDTFTGIPTCR